MKRSKGKKAKAAPVELTDQDLGEVAGGADGSVRFIKAGPLTLTSSTLSGNQATSGDGFEDIIVGAEVNAHVK